MPGTNADTEMDIGETLEAETPESPPEPTPDDAAREQRDRERAEAQAVPKASKRRKVGDSAGAVPAARARVDAPPPAASRKSKAWRAKYCSIDGRELLCVKGGELIFSGLVALSRFIEDNGGTPVINPEMERVEGDDTTNWRGICIVAIDDIIPDHIEATPAILAVGGASALSVQAVATIVRKRNVKTPATEKPKESPMREGPKNPAPARAKDAAPKSPPTVSTSKPIDGMTPEQARKLREIEEFNERAKKATRAE